MLSFHFFVDMFSISRILGNSGSTWKYWEASLNLMPENAALYEQKTQVGGGWIA